MDNGTLTSSRISTDSVELLVFWYFLVCTYSHTTLQYNTPLLRLPYYTSGVQSMNKNEQS